MTKPHYHNAKPNKPKFKYWRLTQLVLGLLLALVLLHSVFTIEQQTDKLAKAQIINTINAQLALIAAPVQLIMQETTNKRKRQRTIAKAQLQTLSNELKKRPEIAKVSFYNQHGESVLATTEKDQALTLFLPIGEKNTAPTLQKGYELHIKALYGQKGELIGFVELVINKYRFTGILKTSKRKNEQKITVLLICSLFLGVLLAKAFSRKHKFPKFNKQKIRP